MAINYRKNLRSSARLLEPRLGWINNNNTSFINTGGDSGYPNPTTDVGRLACEEDTIPLWDDEPPQARKRTPHPVASRVRQRRDEMIFVQAPRKRTAHTASVSVKQVAVPSNLRRTTLSAAHRRSLQDYKGSAQTKQRIEIYLKAGHPFAEAVRRAGARDKRRPSMARARKPIGLRTARQKAADKRAVARLMYDNSRA